MDNETKLMLYVDRLGRKKLGHKELGVWVKITDLSRNILALKQYIRYKDVIDVKWAWTDEEIKHYTTTDEYKQLVAEIDRVKAKFAELNSGLVLTYTSRARSLQKQLDSWNGVASIKKIGDKLFLQCRNEISKEKYPEAPDPDDASLDQFRRFLLAQDLSHNPTVATPGLSDHGQLRAIDFYIKQGGKLIAYSNTQTIKTVWDDPGWTAKLKTAVTQASERFEGPLPNPYEPWHYRYRP